MYAVTMNGTFEILFYICKKYSEWVLLVQVSAFKQFQHTLHR